MTIAVTNREVLAQVAERETGASESPMGSNTGGQILKYFLADDLAIKGKTTGYPWCAAFVSWCVQEMVRSLETEGRRIPGFKPPRLARAYAFENWGVETGLQVFEPPRGILAARATRPSRGDIVVYNFSHCGIVSRVSATEKIFSAVEGNTNRHGEREGYEVANRPRVFSQAKVFIRIPDHQEAVHA